MKSSSRALCFALLAIALVACTPTTSVAQTASPAPSPTASPTATPAAIPATEATAAPVTPAPLGTPLPATPAPVPTATPTPVPVVAPDAPPEIVGFSLSATTVHPGDVLSGSVTASSNVASVEVRVAGYSYVMTKIAPGQFALAVTIPNIPKMFRRTYPLVAIARNTRGDATQRETQITIR